MSIDLAIAVVGGFLGGVALSIALYLWWRLVGLEDKVYRLGWDIDALAGALSRGEGYEATERPDN
jgi:hypothetical protein